MPVYEVTKTGFMFGKLQLTGDRIVTKTKFKNPPSWMKLIADKVESAKHIKKNNNAPEVTEEEQPSSIGEIVEVTN